MKKKRGIHIVITIWQEITIQSLYCDLDMGTNTVMYYKCSHVPNLMRHVVFGLFRYSNRANHDIL